MKAKEETVTTPPPKELEQTIDTPPSNNTSTKRASEDPSLPKEPTFHKEESPSEYPFEDHPEAPLGVEDGSVIPPVDRAKVSLPMTHSLDSGQARQLIQLIQLKGDLGG